MVSLDDFLVLVYCLVDDLLRAALRGRRVRQRGRAPALTDSEVITMEVVGEFLGIDEDKAIFEYFRHHWRAWFPALRVRTTFVRQAANLWRVKQLLQQALATLLGAFDDDVHLIDGVPIPVCGLKRAARATVLRGATAYGYCAAKDLYYFGLKGQLVVNMSGVVTAFAATAANVDDRVASWDALDDVTGLLLGDKGYLSAFFQEALWAERIRLDTPVKTNMVDPQPPDQRRVTSRVRRLIETVIGQLTERFHLAKVRARDAWHFTSRVARKLLAHTVAVALNRKLGRPDLQFEGLLST